MRDQGDIMLVTNQLNLVGEYHDESDARRTTEQAFCKERSGSPNYWLEDDFPDLKSFAAQSNVGAPVADLMEYRAAHGTAMLLIGFDRLADQAVNLAAPGADQSGAAAFNTQFQELEELQDYVSGTWERSTAPSVGIAVQTAYKMVGSACEPYKIALGRGDGQHERAAALLKLVNSRPGVLDTVKLLADKTGAKLTDYRDPRQLEDWLCMQRSRFMGLAAVISFKARGVWKIGNQHITDLKKGSTVDVSKFHIVTRDEFNAEFTAWQQGQVQ